MNSYLFERPRWASTPQVPVDLVITWVNGLDPSWRKSYKKHMGVLPSSVRYLDHGEIELCLASVHKYLPWVRTVYLVTDKQTPSCISLYPKVKVIDHSQILDENCLQPTFNSNVVEAYLHRIPELSEYFLYANDDTFVGEPIKKIRMV